MKTLILRHTLTGSRLYLRCAYGFEYRISDMAPLNQTQSVNGAALFRRRAKVEAVRVTRKNIEAVADWCEAEAPFLNYSDEPYIAVPKADNANIGDWVTYDGERFDAYTDHAFEGRYERV